MTTYVVKNIYCGHALYYQGSDKSPPFSGNEKYAVRYKSAIDAANVARSLGKEYRGDIYALDISLVKDFGAAECQE